MGGHAFKSHAGITFPRMQPPTYLALKQHCVSRLRKLYLHVVVPPEAPEKATYGDLDLIVAIPLDGPESGVNVRDSVGAALGAELSFSENAHLGNFALALSTIAVDADSADSGDDGGHGDSFGLGEGVYAQVDVRQCELDELGMALLMSSYGDMGMIMSLLFRLHGLHLGTKGLKLKTPQGTLPLSTDAQAILAFLGLSPEPYTGEDHVFRTRASAFDWIATSPFFRPQRFRAKIEQCLKRYKRLANREMFQAFINYLDEGIEADFWGSGKSELNGDGEDVDKDKDKERTINKALDFFEARAAYEALVGSSGLPLGTKWMEVLRPNEQDLH
ncbi:hypothetical protein BOTBODRAFT_36745 [Botryobasidium botryosum FD-172 SS1]|uniref:Uncharacterized protein n=1 Tax=Botryobasidium botryosum (strain FD-172 SS1) TaxID=930990 RepID=A0A067M2E5_BOTB1|nr:hypothetical protein BOTBODRAFT_36745 [Botryobasidium botryosum FD-172 SS1]